MVTLLDSTKYVIGVMTLRCAVFECATLNDVNAIRRVYCEDLDKGFYYRDGVNPHAELALYTRDEWINGYRPLMPRPY